MDEALAALFGGEAVAGVKGRLNMEVGDLLLCSGWVFFTLNRSIELTTFPRFGLLGRVRVRVPLIG